MENTTVTAVPSSLNHLTHDVTSQRFGQSTFVTFAEFVDVLAGAGPLEDQDIATGHLEPLYQLQHVLTATWLGHHFH